MKSRDSWNDLAEVDRLREVNRILLRRVAELEDALRRSAVVDELRVRRDELAELREENRQLRSQLRRAGLG